MKEVLLKYIGDIIASIGMGDLPYGAYEAHEAVPDHLHESAASFEYLIYCECRSSSDADAAKQMLQQLLNRPIRSATSTEGNEYIFWYEGNTTCPAQEPEENTYEDDDNAHFASDTFLKNHTTLPAWLDDYIFNVLKACYSPDYKRYDFNLDLNEDELLTYLGTYFPRSFAESFCIMDHIFGNEAYRRRLSACSSINILSLGCGTGGDLIGLLTAIEKHLSQNCKINILAIDGNYEAMKLLDRIITEFKLRSKKSIHIKIEPKVIDSIKAVDCTSLGSIKFDYILSFKMICELIAKGCGRNDDSYSAFVNKFVPMLSEDGLCLLLDVTTKSNGVHYNPLLMNCQTNKALKDLDNFRTLFPLSCSLYEGGCPDGCFYQQDFYVSHQKQKRDLSKVAYRVIGHRSLVETMISSSISESYRYITYKSRYITDSDDGAVCRFSRHNQIDADSYSFKN